MIGIPEIHVGIATRTPLWTGNRDMAMDGVKETGILGSLRWWYEAIIRGFGCRVCDPAADTGRCKYNEEGAQKTGIASDGFYDKDRRVCVCPVCQVFGCTGWGKRFRMRWYGDDGQKFQLRRGKGGQTYRHDKNAGRTNNGYYICSRERGKEGGKCEAVFYPEDEETGRILTYLLRFADRWAGFGARPQFGYGMCELQVQSDYQADIVEPEICEKAKKASQQDLPDLRDFFFCEFTPNLALPNPLKKEEIDPKNRREKVVYDIDSENYFTIETKYRIREALRKDKNISQVRYYICGEVRGEKKISSKIFISRLHSGKIVIRGYLPYESSVRYDREDILNLIYDTINDVSKDDIKHSWIDFDLAGMEYREWLLSLIETPKNHAGETNRQQEGGKR